MSWPKKPRRLGLEFARHLLSRTIRVESGCLLFTGSVNAQGYGTVRYDGRATLAHTALWESMHGPRPKGMELDHTCHDPRACKLGPNCPHRRCLEMDHIELVTKHHNSSPERNNGALQIEIARVAAAKCKKAKTHCLHGHEWTKDNTSIHPTKNSRICRTCQRLAQINWRKRVSGNG